MENAHVLGRPREDGRLRAVPAKARMVVVSLSRAKPRQGEALAMLANVNGGEA